MLFSNLKKLPSFTKAYALATIVMIVLLMIIVVGGVIQINQLAEFTNKIHRHPLVVSNAIQSANSSIISMHRYMKDVSLSRSAEALQEAVKHITREEINVKNQFDIVEERFLGDKNLILKLRSQFLSWKVKRNRVIALSADKKYDEASRITRDEGAEFVEQLIDEMNGIILFARNKASEFQKMSEEKHKNSKRNLILLGVLVLFAGGLVSIFIIYRVLQTQQQLLDSEERFRSAFENLSIGNIVINDKGIIETFNSCAEIIFGYRADEVIGKNISILMPGKFQVYHDEYIQNYLKTGQKHIIGQGRELVGLRKSGEEFPMHLGIGEMKVADKRLFVGSVRDLTEVKAMEARLQTKHRVEAIGQLTGGIAHDFNNLLAIMMGNLELALDRCDVNKPIFSNIQRTLDAVIKSSSLTQQLLSYSRQQKLHPEVLDSGTLIEETVLFLNRTLGENIQIFTHINKRKLYVSVDPSMFTNAILNLSLNARDAMPNGGAITISNSLIEVDEKNTMYCGEDIEIGTYVLITVSDTGEGISPENINSVFEPFFTTKDVGKGSGLGLSMVYGSLRQSNGYVHISSEPGVGTTVSICLPLVHFESHQSTSTPDQVADEITHKKILLVEDDRLVAEATSLSLNYLGYDVLMAENADQGLKLLDENNQSIELLLTDVVMPGSLNGIEMAELALKKYSHLKVLLTSGYPDKIVNSDGGNKQQFRLLPKPFTRAQLQTAIKEVTEG